MTHRFRFGWKLLPRSRQPRAGVLVLLCGKGYHSLPKDNQQFSLHKSATCKYASGTNAVNDFSSWCASQAWAWSLPTGYPAAMPGACKQIPFVPFCPRHPLARCSWTRVCSGLNPKTLISCPALDSCITWAHHGAPRPVQIVSAPVLSDLSLENGRIKLWFLNHGWERCWVMCHSTVWCPACWLGMCCFTSVSGLHPVLLISHTGHNAWMNGKHLEAPNE